MDLLGEVRQWYEAQAEEGYEGALRDLLQYGCESGIVGHLIYYVDTVAFYDKHRAEISRLLADSTESCGLSPAEMFGDKWDDMDPLALDDLNKNLLAWFGFEETARQLEPEVDGCKVLWVRTVD